MTARTGRQHGANMARWRATWQAPPCHLAATFPRPRCTTPPSGARPDDEMAPPPGYSITWPRTAAPSRPTTC